MTTVPLTPELTAARSSTEVPLITSANGTNPLNSTTVYEMASSYPSANTVTFLPDTKSLPADALAV